MRIHILSTIALVLVQSPMVHASADAEREVLARLVHELKRLQSLVGEAERAADLDTRIRFRYDWLRADLERVNQGIEVHIEAPRDVPRTVTPLRGDYRQ